MEKHFRQSDDGEDVYLLYRDFELRFLQYSISTSSVEWVQLYYRRSFRLMARDVFHRRLERMPAVARAHNVRKWAKGFDAWLEAEKQKNERMLAEFKEKGPPPAIEKMVRDAVRRLRE